MSSHLDPDLPMKLSTKKGGKLSAERVTGGGGDPAPARRPRGRLQTRGGDLVRLEEEEYQRR